MTLAERRAAVRAALIADPRRSDRLVAHETGSSREMVASIRRRLETSLGERQGHRIGRDGKSYAYRDRKAARPAEKYIGRVAVAIDAIRSPEFSATWGNTSPGTKQRLIDELRRLDRVIKNLRARMPAEPRPGPSRAKTYRHPDPRRTA
jgi:ElaB/YqjD/DUF883 family membrane-anchored ribosome-binding protein